jgi:hypothetical protein
MNMRLFFFVSLLLAPILAHAQWHQLSGPYGGGSHAFVEIAASNGTRVYAATPNGVYRSINKAQTWSAAGLQGREITHLAQFTTSSPTEEILLASTDSELYRSTDSAKTWKKVFTTDAPGQTFIRAIRQTGTNLYIGVAYFTRDSSHSGIYRSGDIGDTWTKVLAPPAFGLMTDFTIAGQYLIVGTIADGVWREQIGSGAWSQTSYLTYRTPATFVNFGQNVLAGAPGGFWLSTDYGFHWITPPSIGIDTTIPFSTFAIDSDTIVAAGNRGIYRSFDNGRTWSRIDGKGGYPRDYTTYHIDYLSGQWLAGAAAGILTSRDAITWSYASDSILAANVLDVATSGNTVHALTPRGIWRSNDHGLTWQAPNGGRDLQDSLAQHFSTTSDGSLFAVDNGLWRWGGDRWNSLNELSVTSIAGDGVTLYGAVGLRGAIKSTDAGKRWIDISEGLPLTNGRTTLVFTRGTNVFAVAQNFDLVRNEVYLSVDGGAHWALQDGLDVSDPITSFAQADFGMVLGSSNGLFISSDGGHRWEQSPLPKLNIRIDFLKPGYDGKSILAGIEGVAGLPGGLYSIIGQDYNYLSEGVPEIVQGFAADNAQGYLATSSASVWAEGALKSVKHVAAKPDFALRIYPNPIKDRAIVSFDLSEHDAVSIKLYDITGAEQATIFEGTLTAGPHQVVLIVPQLPNGSYQLVLSSPDHIVNTNVILSR